jgi:hypothetical protein
MDERGMEKNTTSIGGLDAFNQEYDLQFEKDNMI